MARYFAEGGIKDITVAFPVNLREAEAIAVGHGVPHQGVASFLRVLEIEKCEHRFAQADVKSSALLW